MCWVPCVKQDEAEEKNKEKNQKTWQQSRQRSMCGNYLDWRNSGKINVCARVHTCMYVNMSIISVIMEVMMEGGLKMMIKWKKWGWMGGWRWRWGLTFRIPNYDWHTKSNRVASNWWIIQKQVKCWHSNWLIIEKTTINILASKNTRLALCPHWLA